MKRVAVLAVWLGLLIGLSACDKAADISSGKTTDRQPITLSTTNRATDINTSLSERTSQEESSTTHTHVYSDATCEEPAICSCGDVQGSALGHNYVNGACSRCDKTGGEVAITLDNWEQYFEVYEWVDWKENAFGEPTAFFGIRISFNLKPEYRDVCNADVACEYLIHQSHCEVTYDVPSKSCVIGEPIDVFDEQLGTLNAGNSESYISFSIGDGGTSGQYTMAKYQFVKMTRVQGTLTF